MIETQANRARRRPDRRWFGSALILLALGLLLAACGKAPGPTGELKLHVGGLPEGVDAQITVTNEAGFEQAVTESSVLALEPGSYTVQAAPVTFEGKTYNPENPSRSAQVSRGAATLVSITFTSTRTDTSSGTETSTSAHTGTEAIPQQVGGVYMLRGVLWTDRDGDGAFDGNEDVLPGVTVFLDHNDNGNRDAGEPHTVTNSVGLYRFEGLEPGRRYTLAQELAANTLGTLSVEADAGRVAHYHW